MDCVGVDGAKAGWIAVWRAGDRFAFEVHTSAQAVVSAHRQARVVAVDVPIGLAEHGAREVDVLARRFVGGRRACSVFSAPVRGILDAASQPEASRRHRAIDGRGFGAQAFGLLAKIRDWDTVLRSDADAARIVREVHPEVSFAALNGGVGLAEGKKSVAGAAKRMQLLSAVLGAQVEALLSAVPRRAAARDDLLDALVALWSAERIAAGIACSLPSPPGRDAVGLPMAIWY
ncbi:DUF429 domain-containing protein [Luteimonas sp. FCS-9]|uniref:DUF429 domain-containing protein n=1 Tax=Luteimonas sp. FCS-9 TaxID=1547516 RepID=UPI00063E7572|nr:DUF429 domain-containing protein [Luteimonas sp. FCS-9]KLI97863.1 hypothetical protein WQ56_16340 [Luteimonas sp. FCS-9]